MERVGQPFATSPGSILLPQEAPPARNPLPAILWGIWTCGFVGIAGSWWIRWRRLRTAVRTGRPVTIEIGIRVISSPALLEPGVFGVFRPVLLLPEGISERLQPAQWKAILAHELCHVRHRDNLAAAIHMFTEAIFWFHPLVWWMEKHMVGERERACDEEVLRLGSAPRDYAESILNVCKLYVESPLPCVSGVTGANLKQRIAAIMNHRAGAGLSVAKKAALAAAGITVVAAPIAIGMLHPPSLRAQSASTTPRFEVASIRPCSEAGARSGTKRGPARGSPVVSPGRLKTGCATLAASYPMAGLIQRAYGRLGLGHRPLGSALPISGGPDWIYSYQFVINAEAAGPASQKTMEGPMLQALLEDRFKLKVHRETREVPVYALTVAKGGPRLPAPDGSCTQRNYSEFPPPALAPGQHFCLDMIGWKGANGTLQGESMTLEYFSKLLGLALGRPVLDRTELTGRYDFHLVYANDQSTPGISDFRRQRPPDDTPAPSIFTAVQQLGLKLEATKGPREFLVVDHVEKPSEN